MNSLYELSAMLRGIKTSSARIVDEARPEVETLAKRSAAGGTSPDGEAWRPRKDGSGRALPNAAAGVTVEASGSVLTIVLSYPYVFHQRSKSKSLPIRQVIPEAADGVPATVRSAIESAAQRVIARTLGGGR